MSDRSLRDRLSLTLRHAAALAASATGLTHRRLEAQRGKIAVLMYHRVVTDGTDMTGIAPGMFVRASVFDRQLAWIRRRWRTRTLGEALGNPAHGPEETSVVITFDDGWRDNLAVAWPLLDRHGVGATIFVATDWVRAGATAEGEFMRPDEVADLAGKGIEFGAHTASHPRLGHVEDARARREMLTSKESVEDWTGRPCELFAYPYGSFRESTVTLARDIFRGSVVVGGGWWSGGGDTARIPRIGVHQDMTSTRAMFEARLASGSGRGSKVHRE